MHGFQRVILPTGQTTWTIIGPSGEILSHYEEYFRHIRASGSPHTLRSYATSLSIWQATLDRAGHKWNKFPAQAVLNFVERIKTGLPSEITALRDDDQECARSTLETRLAAVRAFYTWQRDVHGLEEPYRKIYSQKHRLKAPSYTPFLQGITARREDTPIYKVRQAEPRHQPTFKPNEVFSILDACAIQDQSGSWSDDKSGLRDRLLFATLLETGMRLGQALSLHNEDWHIGAGSSPWIEIVPRQDHPHGCRNKSWRTNRIFISDELEALYSTYLWSLFDHGIDSYIKNVNTHQTFVNVARGVQFAPIRPETIYWRCASIRAQIPALPAKWTPHWFRHTHATALLLAGTDPHVVMRRLGHAHIQTTLGTYGWVTDDAELRTQKQWKSIVDGWRTTNGQ